MNLEHEFTYVATLKPPVQIGAGPFGTRNFFEVTGGTVEGKRLKGKILTGGGDWLLIGPDGYGRLDVRAQFLTDDGASLYVHYTGLLQMNQTVAEALAKGASTDYGDQYFRINASVRDRRPALCVAQPEHLRRGRAGRSRPRRVQGVPRGLIPEVQFRYGRKHLTR